MTQTTAIPQWQDATSYSQGQRGKIEPTAWQVTVNGVCVYITKSHRYNPANWALTCFDIKAEALTLCPRDAALSDAQALALKYVARRLIAQSDRLRSASDALQAIMKGRCSMSGIGHNGGPAFPLHPETRDMRKSGMTLRDYFAGQALIMLPQMGSASKLKPIELAQDAYLMADAMIAARKGGAQ